MGVIGKALKFYKKTWPEFLFNGAMIFSMALIAMLMPQIPQLIIDRIVNPALGEQAVISQSNVFTPMLSGFASDDYMGMLTVMLALMLGGNLLRYICHYARWNIHHFFMMRGQEKMMDAAFTKLLRQSPLVLNAYTSGDLLTVTNNDPVAVKDIFLHYGSFILERIISMAMAVFFLYRIKGIFIIIPAVMGAVTSVVVAFYNRALEKKFNVIRQANVDLSTLVQENINGVRVIRSFATEADEIKKFNRRNAGFRDSYVSLAKTSAKYSVIFSILGESVGIMSVILGIYFAASGIISVGEFATFTAYTTTINGSIIALASYIGDLQNSMVCGRRYFGFIDADEPVRAPENPIGLASSPNIKFEDVGMSFNGVSALDDINIELPYGKKLGIMGKTGSGKSVIMKLMNRLYDPTNGKITLNGNDIKAYTPDEVRKNFSYVMQDVFLFSETVANNIAFYGGDADLEKVERAAELSEAGRFVPLLKEGYSTIVGERGLGLSGGQKQRVSLARAIYKDAPVLLLDDCTSALDYETEKRILENIRKNFLDKTVVITSHRASSLSFCDEIIFIEDGKIAERGTAAELLAKKGRYYEIYSAQEAARLEELE